MGRVDRQMGDQLVKSKDFQVYCCPDDVVGLHQACKQKGLPATDLCVTGYAMKEVELRDPDGYWLRFGQTTTEPLTDCD